MSDDLVPHSEPKHARPVVALDSEHLAQQLYAGAPIVVPGGYRLGSVCIIDTVPRPPLTEREIRLLQGLARIVVDGLERRRLVLTSRAAMRMAAATPDAIVCSDDDGRITFWNDAAQRIFGFSRAEAVGAPLTSLVPDEELNNHQAWMATLLADAEARPRARAIEVRARRRDGSRFPVEISVATWKQGDRRAVGTIVRDLSERDQARERVRFLTHHDRLTDLPNRAAFLEHVDKALRTVAGRSRRRSGQTSAIASTSRPRRPPRIAGCSSVRPLNGV